jgi:hypothetical protein
MADIYSFSSGAVPAMTRQGALSGRAPSSRSINAIIDAELDAAYSNMSRRKALALQQQQLAAQQSQYAQSLAENQRQFEVGQQNAVDTAEATRKSALMGNITNLGSTYLLYKGLKPTPTPGGEAQPGMIQNAYNTVKGWVTPGTSATGGVAPALEGVAATGAETAPLYTQPLDLGPGGYEAAVSASGVPEAVTVAGDTTLGATTAGAAGVGAAGGAVSGAGAAGTEAGMAAAEGLMGGTTGASTLSTLPLAAYTGPAAAGFIAPGILNAIHEDSTENIGHLVGIGKIVGGEKEASAFGSATAGAGAGALAGLAIGGPIGAGVGAIIGGVAGLVSDILGGCIIITACTDRHSPEVEVAREYRDKYMDNDQLRGYYMIAEKVVPMMTTDKIRKRVKKYFVDPLVDCLKKDLGMTKSCKFTSRLVKESFLGLCKVVGMMKESFVRCNGEVY